MGGPCPLALLLVALALTLTMQRPLRHALSGRSGHPAFLRKFYEECSFTANRGSQAYLA
jgi:hypothetical protein